MDRDERISIWLSTVNSPSGNRCGFQFRAEAFNITNTAAFGSPGASFGSATFGVINSAGLGQEHSACAEIAVLMNIPGSGYLASFIDCS